VAGFVAVSDAELERARNDPHFRQLLLTSNLQQLLTELSRHSKASSAAAGPRRALLIKEATDLAVKLADIISRMDQQRRA
jgi:hypothetical protein